MNVDFGAEAGGTPIGDRKSLERLATDINEKERQRAEAVRKRQQEERERANNAQTY